MSTDARKAVSDLMLQRIYGEFLEMPGLRLTCQQAQRLWGLDAPTCLAILELLVERKFLSRIAHGTYARPTEGRPDRLPPQMPGEATDVIRPRIEEAV